MLIAAFQMVADISIHAPREGGDTPALHIHFQTINFNPRPPRGGRLAVSSTSSRRWWIFQSTPPARGATLKDECDVVFGD